VVCYDPVVSDRSRDGIDFSVWPRCIDECDFLVFTCSLNEKNRHMLNAEVLAGVKPGVRIVNVARGPLIHEQALIAALTSGQVHSAALDVMETEPLPIDSPLRGFERNIFGSHNASNTEDAVRATSVRAMDRLFALLAIG
jgi:D-3-phosphoglycerate dehydrogenase